MSAPITLTTDFGLADNYVGQMKGVLAGLSPASPLIDLTHSIAPQNVRQAAWSMADAVDAFSAGTVHLAVVDPGVGSQREMLAVAAIGQFFIAPDNGLLSLIFERDRAARVHWLRNPRYRRLHCSHTFHGRDVMAPAAGAIASGIPLEDLGPAVERPPVRLSDLHPERTDAGWQAGIIAADRFGNLITNLYGTDLLAEAGRSDVATGFDAVAMEPLFQRGAALRVRFGSEELCGLKAFYAAVASGEPLLLLGSAGRLEIAVNGGSAAERFAAAKTPEGGWPDLSVEWTN